MPIHHYIDSGPIGQSSDSDVKTTQVDNFAAQGDDGTLTVEIAPKKHRRLVYKHLAGVTAPSKHLTVPQALDQIGRNDFETWGTQKAFRYMPIILTKTQRVLKYSITTTVMGTLYKITSEEIPAGPSTTEAVKQFRAARRALKEAIESEQVIAIYHKTPSEFSPYPRALLSGTRAKTVQFALGVMRSNRLWCPIFIEQASFERWLQSRRQGTGQPEPQRARYLGSGKERAIAEAIEQSSSATSCYPRKDELTNLIADAVALSGRPPIADAEIKRIRHDLTSHKFHDAGRPKKNLAKLSEDQRATFLKAILLAVKK
ncbi:hypothetical protein SAMN02745157_4547 [Kaistia soli DSM 19436]|uniref:Uncharacterized protein n=1 Tax=Kaistia soli DSM 19436 TaxID=1122133 RepID=A0A1M5LB68_9HYPH|nr:hypothetical protein [Kaistia soli]SHG62258.1 hypothetical protein SAMN02745157_4547 [Kaistia soli DSM 19436]